MELNNARRDAGFVLKMMAFTLRVISKIKDSYPVVPGCQHYTFKPKNSKSSTQLLVLINYPNQNLTKRMSINEKSTNNHEPHTDRQPE
jgi:hypothetical protein